MISRETVDTATRAMDYAASEGVIEESANEAAFVELKKAWGEQAKAASMLSLLDSPRPGTTVKGDGWTAVALSHGVWEFEEPGDYDSLQYFSWKSARAILKDAVRGGATVRLPEEAGS